MNIPTLDTSHVNYEDVYEPAEDSYLMLDVLEKQLKDLKPPTICLEIGSGSGVLIGGVASALGSVNAAYFATDLSPLACNATTQTGNKSGVLLNVLRTDISFGLDRLKGSVDILLCNPPYVATPSEEITAYTDDLIKASWAGGPSGRNVTDKVIRLCKDLLSPVTGRAFIVLEQCNDVNSVMEFTREEVGLKADICGERQAGRERLYILRVSNEIS